jgi:hypothetical protein
MTSPAIPRNAPTIPRTIIACDELTNGYTPQNRSSAASASTNAASASACRCANAAATSGVKSLSVPAPCPVAATPPTYFLLPTSYQCRTPYPHRRRTRRSTPIDHSTPIACDEFQPERQRQIAIHGGERFGRRLVRVWIDHGGLRDGGDGLGTVGLLRLACLAWLSGLACLAWPCG